MYEGNSFERSPKLSGRTEMTSLGHRPSPSKFYTSSISQPPSPPYGHPNKRCWTSKSVRKPARAELSGARKGPDREYITAREGRQRSLDVGDTVGRSPRARDRSLERSVYKEHEQHDVYYPERESVIESDPYKESGTYNVRSSHAFTTHNQEKQNEYARENFVLELQSRLNELHNQYGKMKRELHVTTQKLGSSMHSIKTFWSPELKKERALRKEEAAKHGLMNDQLKIFRSENQKQYQLIHHLEEELRNLHMKGQETEVQQHLKDLYNEKEHMRKEIFLLRETVKDLEMRNENQKQMLISKEDNVKRLMETHHNTGKLKEEERLEMERLKTKFIEVEAKARHLEGLLESKDREFGKVDELRYEMKRRDQEIMAMNAKMRTLDEQHQDYQRHIAVLKESLFAKEEHYSMLQSDVEEMRQKLEEKNGDIEKKTQQAIRAAQEKNRLSQEVQELRDHMEIKDRKINVLQRKVGAEFLL
ncbi:uncharacterized protein LOC143236402 [Tachypleus tridentatus]|uniref:uncharacterized protein LOC143236402 n=1 Tax=Tachypleus tridentatus TaxID=6853 RepID=UPI003FD00E05